MIAIPLMQRVAPPRRPFVWLALLLISASGLLAGVALRSLAPHSISSASTAGGTTSTGSPTTTTATTNLVVTTPQKFTAFICPTTVARGSILTITAYATSPGVVPRVQCAAAAKIPPLAIIAAGVVCKLTFPANAGISTPPVQATDATGTTTWQVAIPTTTAPGALKVILNATWGASFSASWQISETVT
jgi:hypothetical protein